MAALASSVILKTAQTTAGVAFEKSATFLSAPRMAPASPCKV